MILTFGSLINDCYILLEKRRVKLNMSNYTSTLNLCIVQSEINIKR